MGNRKYMCMLCFVPCVTLKQRYGLVSQFTVAHPGEASRGYLNLFEREFGMSKVDAVRFISRCHNWPEIALLIAKHEKPRKVILRDGVSFEAPAIHWWDVDDIFFKHVYNPPFLSFGENDLVVDIGANIGVFTAYAASRTKNNVYAFEPSKSSFAMLKRNIAINGFKNVIPYNFAVADRSGVEMFIDAEVSTACKLMSVKSDCVGRPTEVRTTTLQEIMVTNNIEQIDFLKMDCEGSEGLILGSISVACLKRIKKIAMEFHDGISKVKHDGIQKILEAAGFTTALDWDGRSRLGHLYGWKGESAELRNEPLESSELAEALTNRVGLSVRK